LPQRRQISPDHRGVELAAERVDVGGADQLVLVGAEGHPLGEDVIGVGKPLPRLGVGAVAKADAVLAEQLAGGGVVGDQRALG